jgi:hypothetical protein
VFDWAGAGYASNPNGLAYDPVNAGLWVCPISGTDVRLISTNPAASPRLLNTITFPSSADQLHYDSDNGLLYFTTGGNGSNGSVSVYRFSTSAASVVYSSLQHAQAIEGVYVDRNSSRMVILSDGGYHVAADPELNIALTYSVPLIS